MMETVDCVVIGAGLVGLACGARLAQAGREVLVLEAENLIGSQTSSRNSEVIHAGIYYPSGSQKARLCKAGKEKLYAYARDRGIPHAQLGKVIVATGNPQLAKLDLIRQRAIDSGVVDLRCLSADDVKLIEPQVRCDGALFSPSTGIIDSHAFMLALEGDLTTHGGMVVLQAPLRSGRRNGDGLILEIGGESEMTLRANTVINAAGLGAQNVARSIAPLRANCIPERFLAIGHYYRLSGTAPCSHLIYPVPEEGGLGIHLTLDLAGQAKFGPDVRWIDRIDYGFDDGQFELFTAAIQSYLPGIDPTRLAPDYTGIRPKIAGPGEPAGDFRIDGASVHGVDGLINLFGIESPGLTAALAIADEVVERFRH